MLRKPDRIAPFLDRDKPIDDRVQYHVVCSPVPLEPQRREQLDDLSDEEKLQYYFDIYEFTFRIGLTPPRRLSDIKLPVMTVEEKLSVLYRLWELRDKYGREPFSRND